MAGWVEGLEELLTRGMFGHCCGGWSRRRGDRPSRPRDEGETRDPKKVIGCLGARVELMDKAVAGG